LGILNVENRVKQLHLNYAHKIDTLKWFLKIKVKNITNTTISSRFNYVTPKIKSIYPTFYCNALQDWNLLPDSIKSITDLHMFRKEVKCHLKCTSEELQRCD
jgi:hypothetical protein